MHQQVVHHPPPRPSFDEPVIWLVLKLQEEVHIALRRADPHTSYRRRGRPTQYRSENLGSADARYLHQDTAWARGGAISRRRPGPRSRAAVHRRRRDRRVRGVALRERSDPRLAPTAA